MTLTRLVPVVLMGGMTAAHVSALDAVMSTETWPNNDTGFAACHQRISRKRGWNLLPRTGVKAVDTAGLSYGSLRMLVDASAGVRLGEGRVGINAKPGIITYYLGQARAISEVGVFTYNSDARTNQDFEVRFADNAGTPGEMPTFPGPPDLTTGDKVVGPNSGGCHTCFRPKDGDELVPGKADWVQFRFWPTYNQPAGAPAKDKTKADGWTSLVEIEVLGSEQDAIEVPEDDIDRQVAWVRKALGRVYEKKSTWQETMRQTREALAEAEAEHDPASAFRPYASPVMKGGNPPARVDVPLHGAKRLWLEADVGGDSYDFDQAVWGDPVLLDGKGNLTPLTDLTPVHTQVGWGELGVDSDYWKKPLQVAKQQFKRGLWAHAPSRLCYVLDGKYERFQAHVGIGVAAGSNGSVRFRALPRPSVDSTVDDLWKRLTRDFGGQSVSREMQWEKEDGIWLNDWPRGDLTTLAGRYAAASHRVEPLLEKATTAAAGTRTLEDLAAARRLYHLSRQVDEATARIDQLPWQAIRMAIQDLSQSFGKDYGGGSTYLDRLDRLEAEVAEARERASAGGHAHIERLVALADEAAALQREALLANPLLDFEQLLLVRRRANRLGLPANWQSNSSIPKTGYDNQIALLGIRDPDAPVRTLYAPKKGEFVGDVDLHFAARRMLFSSVGGNDRWHVFEIGIDGSGLRQITPDDQPDVDHYDACYLPDDDIMFCSTANFVGVPCVFGSAHVAMLYRMKPDGTGIRQLCFEQDHDWCPTMLANGRVLYSRWEYADTPHSNTRLLFHMNPDGTGQMEFYGSNSYWPNSLFYARPIPAEPTKFVGIVTGHHGDARMGEMVVFDTALGRHEADGAVQRIPGHGKKVVPIIRDQLTVGVWPKFLHPYPLNEKYFLAACRPTAKASWGIYLVDVFDNMLLLREEPGYALLEPVPLRPTQRPPVLPDRTQPGRTDAVVYLADVYQGNGLKGIPRGSVKELRLLTYHFAYQGMGGLLGVVGMDGPWDVKRIMGTVPVEEDGSAMFRVPANTPISLQPLDAEGKALQLMRSWLTAMPGEVLSCVGCHEPQNATPVRTRTLAAGRTATEIKPWYGPTRGFSYPREVQPVIDKYCVSCHNGTKAVDLRGTETIKDFSLVTPGNGGGRGGKFSVGYANLHRFVRRPGIESDYHLLTPMEFHADTTELVQLLTKGHYGVSPDREAWDRLLTWIDLNAPYHGTWSEQSHDPGIQRQRRRELRKLYAGIDEDPEADAQLQPAVLQAASPPAPRPSPAPPPSPPPGWPLTTEEARKRQLAAAAETRRSVDLGDGVSAELVLVPAGEFVMGDEREAPLKRIRIQRPFWMGTCEVSNEQFRQFDPLHDSRVESKNAYQFGIHGYPLDTAQQPAVRVSQEQARAFCRWLSEQTDLRFSLPTEEQWEYACRAGTDTAFSFGKADTDYSTFANVADAKLREFASNPYTVDTPLPKATKYDDYIPRDTQHNDGGLVTMPVGSYKPNAWGLHDMHGNAWEWTATTQAEACVVRGGSWRDRPFRCRSASRLTYPPYQRVFNVGFRVVCQIEPKKVAIGR